MTPQERKALAEQILTNQLFNAVMGDLESNAIEAMIYAKDDETRARLAMRVQAIRSFRADCEASLRNTEPRKAPV